MKILHILLTIFLFISVIYSYGQKKIILEHKKNPKRQKTLNPDREYTIKTNDTIYYSKMVDITDSTLSILHWVKKGIDTAYIIPQYGKSKDTTIVRPIYTLDTTAILFLEIQYLKKDWFKNTRWLEPFGWIALGSAMTLVVVPVVWAVDGGEKAVEGLEFAGILAIVSLPVIFIGTRQTKYNLVDKWNIKIKANEKERHANK